MKTVIHVNQHIIRANRASGAREPPLTVKTYLGRQSGQTVIIIGADGKEVARVVYRPDNPLSCGAVAWVESQCEVRVE